MDFHCLLYWNTLYGQNIFKMLRPAMLVWVLTSFLTKIGALVEKLLFGNVWGRYGFTLNSVTIIHQFALSISTEQLNILMYIYENQQHRIKTEDVAQCI